MENQILKNSQIMSEVIRQNWEMARHHESNRWRYTYYYYAAFGAYVFYVSNILSETEFDILRLSKYKLILIASISIIIYAIGRASLYHLVYSNIEYKNHIRALEYISSDLGINHGISYYRLYITKHKPNATNNEFRCAYMALPLMLQIRKIMPLQNLTMAGSALSFFASIFFISMAMITFVFKNGLLSCPNNIIIAMSISLIFSVMNLSNLIDSCNRFHSYAERELDNRDPRSLKVDSNRPNK